jgi:hypothetical protein
VLGLTAVVSLLWMAGAPFRVAAQSELDAAQAQEFMGHWLVSFQSDQGEFLVEVELADQDGKVSAKVTTIQLGTQEVTDVTRSEDALELQWVADAQGQLIPVHVELTPQGEDEIAVALDIGDGQFLADGVGKRT